MKRQLAVLRGMCFNQSQYTDAFYVDTQLYISVPVARNYIIQRTEIWTKSKQNMGTLLYIGTCNNKNYLHTKCYIINYYTCTTYQNVSVMPALPFLLGQCCLWLGVLWTTVAAMYRVQWLYYYEHIFYYNSNALTTQKQNCNSIVCYFAEEIVCVYRLKINISIYIKLLRCQQNGFFNTNMNFASLSESLSFRHIKQN